MVLNGIRVQRGLSRHFFQPHFCSRGFWATCNYFLRLRPFSFVSPTHFFPSLVSASRTLRRKGRSRCLVVSPGGICVSIVHFVVVPWFFLSRRRQLLAIPRTECSIIFPLSLQLSAANIKEWRRHQESYKKAPKVFFSCHSFGWAFSLSVRQIAKTFFNQDSLGDICFLGLSSLFWVFLPFGKGR